MERIKAFVSYVGRYGKEARLLKDALESWGIDCFLAHKDIPPLTPHYPDELANALRNPDIMIALMSPGFWKSDWTGQEIGFAKALGYPVLPVYLGENPKGFVKDIQCLRPSDKARYALDLSDMPQLAEATPWDAGERKSRVEELSNTLGKEIVAALLGSSNEYEKELGVTAWCFRVRSKSYRSFDNLTQMLGEQLLGITDLQADILAAAYNENPLVQVPTYPMRPVLFNLLRSHGKYVCPICEHGLILKHKLPRSLGWTPNSPEVQEHCNECPAPAMTAPDGDSPF